MQAKSAHTLSGNSKSIKFHSIIQWYLLPSAWDQIWSYSQRTHMRLLDASGIFIMQLKYSDFIYTDIKSFRPTRCTLQDTDSEVDYNDGLN